MPRFRPNLSLCLFILIAVTCFAQPDPHLTQDPAQRLFTESPFAHGYMHGYEMGYHCGDLDLQMAHHPQDVKTVKLFKAGPRYYDQSFGAKDSFLNGYQAGFRVGYADGYKGNMFSAVRQLRELARDLPEVDRKSSPMLDLALNNGYKDGVKSGLGDGRANADYRPDGADCELALRFKDAPSPFYCAAYAIAYRFGYTDGFQNIRPAQAETKLAGEQ